MNIFKKKLIALEIGYARHVQAMNSMATYEDHINDIAKLAPVSHIIKAYLNKGAHHEKKN